MPERFRTEPRDHRFFSVAAIAVAALVVFGFAQTYPGKLGGSSVAPLPPIIHLHAAVFLLWLGLFVTQTQLVARGRVDLHRRLGTWGIALAGVMLVLGVANKKSVAYASAKTLEAAGATVVELGGSGWRSARTTDAGGAGDRTGAGACGVAPGAWGRGVTTAVAGACTGASGRSAVVGRTLSAALSATSGAARRQSMTSLNGL